jgi:hypothetical protein
MLDKTFCSDKECKLALNLVLKLTIGLDLGLEFFQGVENLFRSQGQSLEVILGGQDLDMDTAVRTALFSLSHDALMSGRYHTYKGALSLQGRDLLLLNEKCADYLARNGHWTGDQLARYRNDLYAELENLG